MKIDKNRRAGLRRFRKILRLKQEELAVLAGVSPETVARFERCKHVPRIVEERVTKAIFETIAKKNLEAVNKAAHPVLEAAEKWDRVLSLEPGSQPALELEKLSGKSLAELKAQAETMADFLRRVANIGLSLLK